nr:methyl-accepting chemotaxis protein [Noviherbaspirillum aridicola]
MLLLIVVGIASWRLQSNIAAMEEMTDVTMAKERLISEWAASTGLNGVRTIFVAETEDAVRREQFQAAIKETSAHISGLQKKLDAFPRDEQEQQQLARIADTRKQYIDARDAVFKEKAVDEAAARRLVQERLEPALREYTAQIRKLSDWQAERIVAMRGRMAEMGRDAQWQIALLGALAVALAVAAAVFITRSIRSELGGEPAQAAGIACRIAEGDLTREIVLDGRDRASLMHAMGAMQQSLTRIVTEVRAATESISTASDEIARGNLDLSSRTEEQASALEETASSMEELTSTVRQNADNARQANQLARTAADVAGTGGEVVSQVVGTMAAIDASSRKIVDIIGVIDGIAFQTNILALNASVEAARAGEQGRGFAVVAGEVRNLAQRAASAAREIKALINDSVQQVDQGSQLVAQAGKTMQEVVTSIARVTDIMAEISAASQEQATGIEHVSQAIAQMDQVTQQNAALVEQAAAASEAMREQAARLAAAVGAFRLAGARAGSAPAMSGAAASRSVQLVQPAVPRLR